VEEGDPTARAEQLSEPDEEEDDERTGPPTEESQSLERRPQRKPLPFSLEKLSPQCRQPLQRADFNRYDVVADGKLLLAELDDDQVRCLVSQLTATCDRTMRAIFIGAMQNALWEEVGRKLEEVARSDQLPAEERKRAHYMLRYPFSDRIFKAGATSKYRFQLQEVTDRREGETFKDTTTFHQVVATGRAAINLPLEDWRWKSYMALTGTYLWGTVDVSSTDHSERAPLDKQMSYPGILGYADTTVLKRNNRFRLKAYSAARKYWDPLPDRVDALGKVGGEVSLRRPMGTDLALSLSGYWREIRYAPPLDPTYNTKRSERSSASAEASYQFDRLGVVTTYDYYQKDVEATFYTSAGTSHAPSILAHIRLEDGYIRVGGGAGVWEDRFKLLEEADASHTKGAEGHGRVEGQWQPLAWLSCNLKVNVAGNRSEGTFNGWYPSTSGSLKSVVSSRLVSVRLSASWYGFRRDLEHFQSRYSLWSTLHASYHPSDRWSVSADAYGGGTKQRSYQPYREGWWGTVAKGGLRMLKNPDLWLELRGVYRGYVFRQDGLSRDKHELQAALHASMKL
jgi:hypothetical protein